MHSFVRCTFVMMIIWICTLSAKGQDFNPVVTARCERGYMVINVATKQPFNGIIHTRDYRNKPHCFVTGSGGHNTTLRISAIASRGETSYCGVSGGQDTDEERHAAIAVRLHRTIELQDDKYFLISCSQSSFYSGKNRVRSRVRLQLLNVDGSATKHRLAIGGKYLLRAQLQSPTDSGTSSSSSSAPALPTPVPNNERTEEPIDSSPTLERLIASDYRLFLRQCIAFGQLNASETLLIDSNGCSTDKSIMTPFSYSAAHRNGSQTLLDAQIESMFKLPDSNRLHIQCDALLCAPSIGSLCERRYTCGQLGARSSSDSEEASALSGGSIVRLVTATTVYVLDADQADAFGRLDGDLDSCDNDRQSSWLIALSAVLGSLLLIMLLVNICLCGSMTCTCGRSERHTEDDSTIGDYDPYKVDWSASHGHHNHHPHSSYAANPADSLPRMHSAYAGHDLSDDSYEPNQRSLSRYSNSYNTKQHQPTGYHNYGYR